MLSKLQTLLSMIEVKKPFFLAIILLLFLLKPENIVMHTDITSRNIYVITLGKQFISEKHKLQIPYQKSIQKSSWYFPQ